jgi:23S rRNA pseudouridine1911/1915/1917 synthase
LLGFGEKSPAGPTQPERHLNEPLSILFEDEHCLAVNKPAGQFAQGIWAPEGLVTLETAVRGHLNPLDPGSVYLGIVHRLDRPTSGVILWAKTQKAARRLSLQFQNRRALKEYWAIVESHLPILAPDPHSGHDADTTKTSGHQVWNDWITRPDASGRSSVVEPQTPGARQAVTRLVASHATELPARCTWLRLWPETGRTHQLRIQSARRGLPILGDQIYGASPRLGRTDRIALHARSLTIKHPTSGQELILIAPIPSWWREQGIVLEV